ncbi:MAG: FliH/SctL family protein [Myxococcota bacterium]
MSRVIRGKDKVVPGEVVDAHERASSIVSEAEAKAKALVEAAEQEAAAIRSRAEAEGTEAARAEAAALLVAAEQALREARAEAEPKLVALAIGAAEQLLRAELELAPAKVHSLVGEVLDRARRAREQTLHVHPDDAPTLRTLLPGVVLHEDESLERGDCVVETDLGRLDGRLSVRVAALRRVLEGNS